MSSLRLQPQLLDQRAPALGLGLDEGGELLRASMAISSIAASRSPMPGSAMMRFISALSFSMIGFGVPAGASSPYHSVVTTSKPCSLKVGISGTEA